MMLLHDRQYPKSAAGDRKVTTVLTIHPKDKDGISGGLRLSVVGAGSLGDHLSGTV